MNETKKIKVKQNNNKKALNLKYKLLIQKPQEEKKNLKSQDFFHHITTS